MNENKTPNPQAFPDPMRGAESSITNQTPFQEDNGMTLRDYFAAKAINGILCNSDLLAKLEGSKEENDLEVSETAYRLADAMLKYRNI